MFTPKILETINSMVSGKIEVRKLDWDTYVTTHNLTQSGGLIKDLWQNTLKKVGRKFQLQNQSWLILGLATGTLAKLISQKYSPTAIVGVELDPQMLRVGNKYFGLNEISPLEIVMADAKKYIASNHRHFDWVIVDLYVADQLPRFVYSPAFISQVKKSGHRAIFNHLFYDRSKQTQAELLNNRLAKVFSQIQLVRELTNLLIVCS